MSEDSSDRLIAGGCANPNEENVDRALRPTRLADYVGQKAVREQLQIFIELRGAEAIRSTICSFSGRPV